MENRKLSLVFIAVLVVSLVSGLQFTHNAAGGFFDLIYLPEITINKDGSITPETSLISVSGNVYTLTGDVDGYSIVIERSNMVFDGSGFTINATSGDNPGLKMMNANGVTIRDVNVYGGHYSTVQVYLSSNCQFFGVHADKRGSACPNTATQTSSPNAPQIYLLWDRPLVQTTT